MANDATYLRKMLEERGKLTFYGDGLKDGTVLKSDNSILIVGDVGKNARIVGEDKVFVVGNVLAGADIEARDSVVVTGKSEGYVRARSEDKNDTFSIVIEISPDETLKRQVVILGHDDAKSEQAVHESMDWLGSNYPLKKPRSLARKFGIAVGVAPGGTALALGYTGLKTLGLSPEQDMNIIFNGVAAHPFWTLIGAYGGFLLTDMGRPKVAPLALRDQRVPLPVLPAPVKKLPAPKDEPLI